MDSFQIKLGISPGVGYNDYLQWVIFSGHKCAEDRKFGGPLGFDNNHSCITLVTTLWADQVSIRESSITGQSLSF